MFDFQKLIVYQQSIEFYTGISHEIIKKNLIDKITKDQSRRASRSIALNIAERIRHFSPDDRRNFYTITRGSLNECIAILDLLIKDELINVSHFLNFSKPNIHKARLEAWHIYTTIILSIQRMGSEINILAYC